jgi:N-acetylglucosamine kinase-like BadF-type ATPase
VPEGALVAAVDGGGSRSRAVLAVDKKLVARVEAGPLQLTTMSPGAIRRVLDGLVDDLTRGTDLRLVTAICLGIAGAGAPERRAAAERWAKQRLPSARITVCRDVDLVLAAGGTDGTGIAAIAGTGAIVLGRNREGVERKADGRGPLVADRGGAFQLGLDAIRLVVRSLDVQRRPPQPLAEALCAALGIATPGLAATAVAGRDGLPFAQIAALGGAVCALAADGDLHSQQLVRAAAAELAASYRAVRRRLPGADELRHLLSGGVATTRPYRDAFVRATGVPRWRVVSDPVLGGLAIARWSTRDDPMSAQSPVG